MIPKSHFNLVLALTLFFVSFLAYVYVTQQYQIGLLQYQLLKLQSPTLSPNPSLAAKASATAATWQTYKNDRYSFEFQYPQGWSYDNLFPGKENDIEIHDKQVSISVRINSNHPSGLSGLCKNLLECIKSTYGFSTKELTPQKFAGTDAMNSETYSFSGSHQRIFFMNNQNYFEVEILDSNKDSFSPIIDQILSTFKFID